MGKSLLKHLKNEAGQNPIEAAKYGVEYSMVHMFIIFKKFMIY